MFISRSDEQPEGGGKAVPARVSRRSRIRGISLTDFSFLLTFVAFSAISIRYFGLVFTTSTRWIFLALLLAILALRGKIFIGFRSGYNWILLIYLAWCLATVLWSDVPELSLLKSLALVLTVLALLSGGHYWATTRQPEAALGYLAPIVALCIVSGLGGSTARINASIQAYEGLTGNPNMLGILVAVAMPFALFSAYRGFAQRRSPIVRCLRVLLAGILLLLLAGSASRAAILCMLLTTLCGILTLTPKRKVALLVAASGVLVISVVIAPRVQQSLYQRFVLKGAQDVGDITFSRVGPWTASYAAAVQGGYFGLGYGVSAGQKDFSFGLTAEDYGREKGNTQLAVWEETGLIGLGVYATLLVFIFRTMYRAVRASVDRDTKVVLGLLSGLLVGLTGHSAFEAWWVAPGSFESAAFWATLGVGSGLASRVLRSLSRPTPKDSVSRVTVSRVANA